MTKFDSCTTNKQLIELLLTDPTTLDELSILKKAYEDDVLSHNADVQKFYTFNPYLLQLFTYLAVGSNHVYVSTFRHNVKEKTTNFSFPQPGITDCFDNYNQQPTNTVLQYATREQCKLFPQAIFNRHNEFLLSQKFDAARQTLSLDMFSYTIFENHLKSLTKPLTGKDAVRYMEQVRPDYKDNADTANMKFRYINLIWTYGTHTIAVIKHISGIYTGATDCDRSLLPFMNIRYSSDLSNDVNPTFPEHVHLSNYLFVGLGNRYSMPTSDNFNREDTYTFTSNVVKATNLTETEIQMTLDKIVILTEYIRQANPTSPCFQNSIDNMLYHLEHKADTTHTAQAKSKLANSIIAKQDVLKLI